MRNFNKIALVTALSITGGGGMVDASELGGQQMPNYVDIMMPDKSVLGNVAIQGSLHDMGIIQNSTDLQIDENQLSEELQPVTPAETAVRIGNMVQMAEPPPPPETVKNPIPNFFNWLRLADCESGGDWAINTGNGYYGGLQFSLSTWRAVGGLFFAIRPDLATPEQQMLIAENLLVVQGWGAWPACTRKLGLR